MQDPADPNAVTRTAAPIGGDADRTQSAGDDSFAPLQACLGGTQTAPGHVSPGRPRLPAPLQYRDPERYELQAEHGRGGLGRVLRARDRELGRSIAIKELLRPTPTSELRFFREALITARLEHPSIVPVHEAGRWPDGTPFYAMKLVAGRPLREAIDAARSPENRLALIPHVIAVADAIAYAHSKRIIHRDLKPSNVLVGDFGETVVIDWGLAKDLDEPEATPDEPTSDAVVRSSLTITGTILGTPGYMPPEQEGGVADERSDVYALGAILYCLVFNHPPGESAPTDVAVVARVPSALLAIITKAMASEPARRYATARDLAQDLRDFQGGRLVSAHRYSVRQLVGHWASQHKRILAVVAVAALLLAATLVVSARRVLDERTDAEVARDRAEDANASLVLSHARNAVATNPTKALLWLARYHGPDASTAQDIAAEALGRGVSRYVLNGHDRPVARVDAIDEHTLMSGARGSALIEWHLDGPRVTSQRLVEHLDARASFQYHPGHRRLVYADARGEIRVRDAGAVDRTVARHDGNVGALQLSRDGGRVIVGAIDGRALLIDLDRADAPIVLAEPSATLHAFGFVDGDRRILLATADGAVTAFDGHSGRRVSSLALRPIVEGTVGDRRAVVVHADRAVTIVTSALAAETTITVPEHCREPVLSHGETLLALGCRDQTVVLSLPDGTTRFRGGHAAATRYPVFSADDRWIGFGTSSGAVELVSTVDWTPRTLVGHAGKDFPDLAFRGDRVVSADDAGEIRVWPLPRHGRSASFPGEMHMISASPDGTQLVTSSNRGVVRLWDADGTLRRELPGHAGVIASATFSRDGSSILSAGFDGTARVWPLTGDAPPVVLPASPTGLTNVLSFGSQLVTLGEDGRVLLWDVTSRTSTLLHRDAQAAIFVDARSHRIAFGGAAGIAYEYDDRTGRVREIARHAGALAALRYTADGRWLMIAGVDGVVRLVPREPDGAAHVLTLPAAVVRATVSPDSRLLAVASDDRRVRVYALDTGGPRLVATHEADVRRLRFAPTGQTLAAVCADATVRLWDLARGEATAFALGDQVPYHVDFVQGGAAIALVTSDGLAVLPRGGAVGAPASVDGLHDLVRDTVLSYQQPRKAGLDERFLFSPSSH